MTEKRATYSEGREPMIPEPKHRYDWRRQPTADEASEYLIDKLKPRHVAGLSIYGPYFTGDPLDHAEWEYLDDWHYIQAARRERYAYKLALRDIMARIRYAGCQDASDTRPGPHGAPGALPGIRGMSAEELCVRRSWISGYLGLIPASDREFLARLDADKRFVDRDEAEASNRYVQIIACAVIIAEDGLYQVFATPPADAYDRRGPVSLIVGGHIDRVGEADDYRSLVQLALRALEREIVEELGW